MDKLKVDLNNCYGIQYLEYEFDFEASKQKSFAIYAPNGFMKTSFSRTFEDLANGQSPKEERYNRPSSCEVKSDGTAIPKENIYVLKSEMDISSDSPAITNILVDPQNKARYDELVVDLNKQKNKLIKALQRLSNVKQSEIEESILRDWQETDFPTCIKKIMKYSVQDDLSPYKYGVIFDPKAIAILASNEFLSKANEFNERYHELFEQAGSLYQKGVFNPAKAETSFSTLDKQGFFKVGHRVHLKGEAASIDKEELNQKLQTIHQRIDGDDDLKKLKDGFAKNAQTQALANLIENLSSSQFEYFLERLMPQYREGFKKDLWAFYIQSDALAPSYIEVYEENKTELESIEASAAGTAPRWAKAVELFNDRFVDMPFTLSVENQAQAVLGKENARLKFTFEDGDDSVECFRNEVKTTLSQGERRALYLLNFIFEVGARKLASQETIFILDDIADSFDYKNKHAIVQYLDDLNSIDFFHQIILTHNFDFFRALANSFVVHRDRCLMTRRNGHSEIVLAKAEGIKNYFINVWKQYVDSNDHILCATIPFVRNLIEYTKGDSDPHYFKLTSLLHWKPDTGQITVGEYFDIYNELFSTAHDNSSSQIMHELMIQKSEEICSHTVHDGLNLEDKVLLSIVVRVKSEIFLTERLCILKNDSNYWCQSMNQFGSLMKEFTKLSPSASEIRTLEKVSVTVSSNIHLNSFMYEPILDLTIEHLIDLYKEVDGLNA